jgi:hypothetical protein
MWFLFLILLFLAVTGVVVEVARVLALLPHSNADFDQP